MLVTLSVLQIIWVYMMIKKLVLYTTTGKAEDYRTAEELLKKSNKQKVN